MELNVLVIGMPNVGKSTLLNALRNIGIKGRQCLLSLFPCFPLLMILSSDCESATDFCTPWSYADVIHEAKALC